MNYLELIQKVIRKLNDSGFIELAQEVSAAQASASFGGELIMQVSHCLLKIKSNRKDVYSIISPEVEDIIDYANSIGLYPK